MKKTLLFILLSVLTYSNVNSQSYIGIRASFNSTSLTTSNVSIRPAFSVGAMYRTEISDDWNFEPAILYSLSGVKSSSGYKPSFSAHTYSLEIPLIFSRRFGSDDITFGIDMGPFLKYGLHGGYWEDNLETGEREKLDIFDYQKRFDVGPQVGFNMFVYNFYIGYAFQYGLIKPWDDKRGNHYNSCINIGYMFELE